MKIRKSGIVVAAAIGVLAVCWLASEDKSRTAPRLNSPSHVRQIGLNFRHERNDIAGFTLMGEVQKQEELKTAN